MKRIRRFGYDHATEIALFFATCALLAAACGCTSTLHTVKVAEYAASETVISGYRALNIFDQQKLTAIRDKAHAGHLQEAETDLAVYVPVRGKVFQALDDAALLLDTVDKAVSAVVAGVKAPADLLSYLPQLVEAGLAVKDALAVLGVTP